MKTDGFGIEHYPNCPSPEWSSVRADTGSADQRCRRCGVTWRAGDPTTSLQPRKGFRSTKKRNKS